MAKQTSIPAVSWSMLKRIVRAYGAVQEQENPTVDEVARLAGIARPVVSANNNFLRDFGVILSDKNKPTPIGAKLAAGLAMDNDTMVTEVLQELVRGNGPLRQIVSLARARGSIKLDHFKGEAAFVFGMGMDKAQLPTIKTILDLLQEAKLLSVTEDLVRPGEMQLSQEQSGTNAEAPLLSPSVTSRESQHTDCLARVPIPLGPNRLAYIELPNDWKSRELPKLLKLLEIALGEEEGS